MKRWIVVPDMQVPYHDPKTVRLIAAFATDIGCTDMLIVGDELDAPAPSRWVRGRQGEFAGTLQRDIDTCREVLSQLREAVDGEVLLMRSNHGDRIRNYTAERAAALSPLRALQYERLMDFDGLGIDYKTRPHEFAKGWVLAHGDEGSLSRIPGGTAMNLAKKWGKSVVCGHTHRAGLQHSNDSLNGKITRHLFGLEVGHAMTLTGATYLAAQAANWQQACAVLEEDDRGAITPYLIPIIDRKIRWAGEVYSA